MALFELCISYEYMKYLSVAMASGLGGNPYGPAGTGKTESVKALGGLFGRQVLVFNCDEVQLSESQSVRLSNHCIELSSLTSAPFFCHIFII